MTTEHFEPTPHENISTKLCVQCGEMKPLNEFLRRTGRRAGGQGRRGTCRDCRRGRQSVETLPAKGAAWHPHHAPVAKHAGTRAAAVEGDAAQTRAAQENATQGDAPPVTSGRPAAGGRSREASALAGEAPSPSPDASGTSQRPAPRKKGARGSGAEAQSPSPSLAAPPLAVEGANAAAPDDSAARKQRGRGRKRRSGAQARQLAELPRRDTHDPADASFLRTTASGFIRMRGKTDNGRRWYQEVELDLAQILVREGAAVVVNRSTIRRLYSNKEFRKLILTRDNYICRFCGNYGDTIDHELPRAKGGHTTPANCVCACYECNQRKANRDADEFRSTLE